MIALNAYANIFNKFSKEIENRSIKSTGNDQQKVLHHVISHEPTSQQNCCCLCMNVQMFVCGVSDFLGPLKINANQLKDRESAQQAHTAKRAALEIFFEG